MSFAETAIISVGTFLLGMVASVLSVVMTRRWGLREEQYNKVEEWVDKIEKVMARIDIFEILEKEQKLEMAGAISEIGAKEMKILALVGKGTIRGIWNRKLIEKLEELNREAKDYVELAIGKDEGEVVDKEREKWFEENKEELYNKVRMIGFEVYSEIEKRRGRMLG